MSEQNFDFDAWLDGATVAEASVDIYANLQLLGRYQEWERRYEAAQSLAEVAPDERSMGDDDPISELEAEGEQILEGLRASKATWYLAALSSEDEAAIVEAHPIPAAPVTFDEPYPTITTRPTEAQADAYLTAFRAREEQQNAFNVKHMTEIEAHNAAVQAVLEARGAEKIVRSFRRVEAGGKVSTSPLTVAQAKALPSKIGEPQVSLILKAVDAATSAEPVIPAPFSRKSSEDNRE